MAKSINQRALAARGRKTREPGRADDRDDLAGYARRFAGCRRRLRVALRRKEARRLIWRTNRSVKRFFGTSRTTPFQFQSRTGGRIASGEGLLSGSISDKSIVLPPDICIKRANLCEPRRNDTCTCAAHLPWRAVPGSAGESAKGNLLREDQ